MKLNKHILFLTPGFPVDEEDTTCIPPLQVYLKKLKVSYPDIRLSVITFQYPFKYKEYKWFSITVYACGGRNKKLPYKLLIWNRVLKYFKKISKLQKVDVIHSYWLFDCALLGNFIAKKSNIGHIVTLMGQDAKSSNRYRRWIDLTYCKTICLSENHKKIFQKTSGIESSEIIPWGIDPVDFEKTTQTKEKIYDIIGVGSFIELKNYTQFINVIDELVKSKINVRAMIVGGGPQQNMIIQEINKRGLGENIEVKTQIPRNKALQLMSKSKILLHTSIYESQGYVFYEALHLGLRIVSFNVGAAKKSNSWYVARNEQEMIDGLREFLSAEKEKKHELPPLINETVEQYSEYYLSMNARPITPGPV